MGINLTLVENHVDLTGNGFLHSLSKFFVKILLGNRKKAAT